MPDALHMTVSVAAIDPVRDPRWLDYVSAHPEGGPFHHPAWIQTLASVYQYRLNCLAAFREERVVGVLPLLEIDSWLTGKRAVSLPFTDRCPPLVDDPQILSVFWAECRRRGTAEGWDYVEVRADVGAPEFQTASEFKRHLLRLDASADVLWQQCKQTRVQQPIERAKRAGVRVEKRQDAESMREFVRLNAATRRRLGVPPQSDRFFGALRELVLAPGLGFLSLAVHGERVIAGAIFLHFGKTLLYKYAASDARALSLGPNPLLLWDAIHWGKERGCAHLDMGRTDLDNEGLLGFKRAWGTEEQPLVYRRLDFGQKRRAGGTSRALQRCSPLFRRLPVWLLKAIGRAAYRHVG